MTQISQHNAKEHFLGGFEIAARNASPWTRIAHGFSQQADKRYMTLDHCILYLGRKLGEHRRAKTREGSFFGRIYNRLTFGSLEYVLVSGAVLVIVAEYLGFDLPEGVKRRADYLVSFKRADALEQALREKARHEGLIV